MQSKHILKLIFQLFVVMDPQSYIPNVEIHQIKLELQLVQSFQLYLHFMPCQFCISKNCIGRQLTKTFRLCNVANTMQAHGEGIQGR